MQVAHCLSQTDMSISLFLLYYRRDWFGFLIILKLFLHFVGIKWIFCSIYCKIFLLNDFLVEPILSKKVEFHAIHVIGDRNSNSCRLNEFIQLIWPAVGCFSTELGPDSIAVWYVSLTFFPLKIKSWMRGTGKTFTRSVSFNYLSFEFIDTVKIINKLKFALFYSRASILLAHIRGMEFNRHTIDGPYLVSARCPLKTLNNNTCVRCERNTYNYQLY